MRYRHTSLSYPKNSFEIIENHPSNTLSMVYCVCYEEGIYNKSILPFLRDNLIPVDFPVKQPEEWL